MNANIVAQFLTMNLYEKWENSKNDGKIAENYYQKTFVK